jgi:hypothetical protein
MHGSLARAHRAVQGTQPVLLLVNFRHQLARLHAQQRLHARVEVQAHVNHVTRRARPEPHNWRPVPAGAHATLSCSSRRQRCSTHTDTNAHTHTHTHTHTARLYPLLRATAVEPASQRDLCMPRAALWVTPQMAGARTRLQPREARGTGRGRAPTCFTMWSIAAFDGAVMRIRGLRSSSVRAALRTIASMPGHRGNERRI